MKILESQVSNLTKGFKMSINVFTANLPYRVERRKHIAIQFENKKFFFLEVTPTVSCSIAAKSLWLTIQQIIKVKVDWQDDFFVFCEDDHQFTEHYNFSLLKQTIKESQALDADILCGGVSWFKTGVQVSNNLFWVERFSGLQFTVIFKKFYSKIVKADFTEQDAADYKISELTDKKFVIYPFISIQKDFGYSDVTAKNNETGRVERLFEETSERFELLKKVRSYYLPDFKS